MMFDLARYIPEVKDCTSAIVTAGGKTLGRHIDTITLRLDLDPHILLVEVNGHYFRRVKKELAALPNIKIHVAMDWRLPETGQQQKVGNIVREFLEMPNSWFITKHDRQGDKCPQMITAEHADSWDEYERATDKIFSGGGGSLAVALTCLPPELVYIQLYGADKIAIDSDESIDPGPDGWLRPDHYSQLAARNRIIINQLTEMGKHIEVIT